MVRDFDPGSSLRVCSPFVQRNNGWKCGACACQPRFHSADSVVRAAGAGEGERALSSQTSLGAGRRAAQQVSHRPAQDARTVIPGIWT